MNRPTSTVSRQPHLVSVSAMLHHPDHGLLMQTQESDLYDGMPQEIAGILHALVADQTGSGQVFELDYVEGMMKHQRYCKQLDAGPVWVDSYVFLVAVKDLDQSENKPLESKSRAHRPNNPYVWMQRNRMAELVTEDQLSDAKAAFRLTDYHKHSHAKAA